MTCLLSACAGIPVLPDTLPACPPEALTATKRLAIPATAYFEAKITGGAARRGSDRHNLAVALTDGPVEAKVSLEARGLISWQELEAAHCNVPVDPNELTVIPEECRGRVIVPQDSILYGEAKAVGNRVQIRFNRLRLPDGKEMPFCAYAYWMRDDQPGVPKNRPESLKDLGLSSPPPGTSVIGNTLEIRCVEELPRKP